MLANSLLGCLCKASENAYQNSIPSTWSTSTLGVTEARHSSIKTKAFGKDNLDVVSADRVEFGVMGAFCYNDDGLSLAYVTVLIQSM